MQRKRMQTRAHASARMQRQHMQRQSMQRKRERMWCKRMRRKRKSVRRRCKPMRAHTARAHAAAAHARATQAPHCKSKQHECKRLWREYGQSGEGRNMAQMVQWNMSTFQAGALRSILAHQLHLRERARPRVYVQKHTKQARPITCKMEVR